LTLFKNISLTIKSAGSNAAMNWLYFREPFKHWIRSPAYVFDQRAFIETPDYVLTSPRAIQTKAIITSKLKIKKGGSA
jgi:hypothetical protein